MNIKELVERSQGERGYIYPDVFHSGCGLGIVIPKDKLHAIKSWGSIKSNPKRRATLQISTFRGTSSEAIHFYGEIEIQGVYMEYDNDKPGHGTLVDDPEFPLASYSYVLVLRRPITKQELSGNPERWGEYYEEGDLTNCFESIWDIMVLSKEIFENRFSGEWEFMIKSPFFSGDFTEKFNEMLGKR